jgi:molecular chaperone GrpE (heat shock protein)
MFRKIWYNIFQKKEENMTTTANTTRSDAKLKKQIAAQSEQIGNLRTRISELVDRMTILQSDLDGFKKNVSKDLLEVIDHLKKNK